MVIFKISSGILHLFAVIVTGVDLLLFFCAHSCPTLAGLMDYSLPGSSVHGIFRARILEWGSIIYSKWGITPTQGSNPFLLQLLHWQVDFLPLAPPGKPIADLLLAILVFDFFMCFRILI